MESVSHRGQPDAGFRHALRQLRDPLLLFAVPVTIAVLTLVWGWLPAWGIGFDFVGTLWEPARALLDGRSMYPEAVRDAIVVGNPSVYPPPAIVASVPLALLPAAAAAWVWFAVLGASVFCALRLLGVRDWRCHVITLTSPVVVHGLVFGNLTVLLVLAIALAWRYRDRASVVGLAVGAAIAAKFVVWPLVAWLLVTRRYRAAAWSVSSAALLVIGVWAAVGFDGLSEYPALLRELQDVYATRSISVATIAGGIGASQAVAVAASWVAGLALVAVAAWQSRGADGDRRAFVVVVAASVLASPIVWPYSLALLYVPVAIVWPRFTPVWLFGYVVWLVGAVSPRPVVEEVCCRPADVPEQAWDWSHASPTPWYALGVTAVALAVTTLAVRSRGVGRTVPVGGTDA